MTSLKDWKIQGDSPNPLTGIKRPENEVMEDVAYRLMPLEPQKQLEAIKIPEYDVSRGYVGSEDFKNILRRYKSRGPESLTPEEQGQLGAAVNGFPEVAQFVDQVKQAKSAIDKQQRETGFGGGQQAQQGNFNYPPGKRVAVLAEAQSKNDMMSWLDSKIRDFAGDHLTYSVPMAIAGEKIVNTFKDIIDNITYTPDFNVSKGNGQDTGKIQIQNKLPERSQSLELLGEAMRQNQGFGKNLVAGAIEFMPYMIPAYGQAIFADDIKRSNFGVVKDMAVQCIDSWKNFGMVASGYASKEQFEEWRKSWEAHPLETAFIMALPIFIGKSIHSAIGKGGSGGGGVLLSDLKKTVSEVDGGKSIADAMTKLDKAIDADIEAGKPKVPAEGLGEFEAIKKTPDVELRNELLAMQKDAKEPLTAKDIAMMDRGDLEYHISGGRIERPAKKIEVKPKPKEEPKPKPEPSPAVSQRRVVEAENELFDKTKPGEIAKIQNEATKAELTDAEYASVLNNVLKKDNVTVEDFKAAIEDFKKPAKEEKPVGEPITQKELDAAEKNIADIESDINQRKTWLGQMEEVNTKDAEAFKLSIKKQMAGLQVDLQEANKKMAEMRRRPIKEEEPPEIVEAKKVADDLGIRFDGTMVSPKGKTYYNFTDHLAPKGEESSLMVEDLGTIKNELERMRESFKKAREDKAAELTESEILKPEETVSESGATPEIKSSEPAVESERVLEPDRYDEAGNPKNRLQSEELLGEKDGDKLFIASYEMGDVVRVIEQKDGSKVFKTEKPDGTITYETEGNVNIPESELADWFTKKESEIGYDLEEVPLEKSKVQEELKGLKRFALHRSHINIDLKRFQKRLSAFSAASVRRIVSNFVPAEMDPLVIWKDPKDGKYYLLKGHSRFEATGKLGIEELPVVEFTGTEAEAIKFAERSNLGATGYDIGVLIDIYKDERAGGASKKDLDKLFPGKANRLEAFSYLDPKGMFRRLLEDPAFSEERGATSIDQKAREVGELRKIFPELTNQHEKQIFEALYPTDKNTSLYLKMSKNDFAKFIERQVTDLDFQTNPEGKVLNFGKANITDLRARPDTKNVMLQIDKLKNDIKKLREEKDSKGAAIMIQEKQADIQKLYNQISKFADKQTDVFGELYREIKPLEEMGGGLGVINPFKSLNQKLFNKLREIKEKRLDEGDLNNAPPFLIEDVNDIGVSSFVQTLSHLFGTYEGQKPKYGQNAKMVARDIILTNVEMKGKIGSRGSQLSDYLKMVDPKDTPRKWNMKRDWSNFYDHVTDPSRDSELQPSSLEAAKKIREFMQADRETLIDNMREEIRPAITKLIERQFRLENDMVGKKLKAADRIEIMNRIESAIMERYPDDWGYDNYLSQIHPGKWEVIITKGEENSYIGYGETRAQALNVAMKHYADNIDSPGVTPDAYTIRGRAFSGGEIDRISRRKFYKLVNEIADAAEDFTPDEIRGFLQGKIGTKEGRKKFAFFKQKRTDAPGFTKDLPRVLHVYNQAFVRSQDLTSLNRRIVPTLDYIKNIERRPRTAEYLQRSFDYLWARPQSELSKRIDATLQNIPGIGDNIRPMWLERTLGNVKGASVAAFIKLKPTFHLANAFQLYQTTAPTVKGVPFLGEWRDGGLFYSSAEGKALREKYNIPYLTGGKTIEGGRSWTSAKFREKAGRLAPETYNQEMAWSIMFKRAKTMGMSDLAANEYALINGCIRTQFLHLESDMMEFSRGPIASTIFQFKRFMVKDLELATDLLKTNRPGLAKWLGAKVLFGGAKLVTKTAGTIGGGYLTLKAYNELKKEIGDYPAQVVMYGLPGLIGLDLSNTINVVDVPYGETVPEKIGNVFLSPLGASGIAIASAARDTKGPEYTTLTERVMNKASQRFPFIITRTIYGLQTLDNKLQSGEYEFKDAAGRLKYRGDLRDVLLTMAGGRTAHESDNEILIGALTTVSEKYDLLLDRLAQDFMKADAEGHPEDFDWSDALDWNELYPDCPVNSDALRRRIEDRYKYKHLDRFERMLIRSPKQMRGIEQFEEKMKNFGGK